MTDKVTTFLWFDTQAEEAAHLYCSLLPDSRIDAVTRSPIDYPNGKEGDVLIVQFTLGGRSFTAMNGGPGYSFTPAISLMIHTDDQTETDRLWDGLIADGGVPSACGWLKDRYGLSWQVTPKRLLECLGSEDRSAAKRAMEAMTTMIKIDVAAIDKAFAGEDA